MAQVIETTFGSTAIAPSVTDYLPIGDSRLTVNTTEANVQVKRESAGTFSLLYCRISASTTTSAATLKLRKNTANGNQSVSITAGTTGEFTDSSNTDSVAVGDLINAQIITGAGSATTLTVTHVTVVFAATTGTVKRFVNTNSYSLNSTVQFVPIGGGTGTTTNTESDTQAKIKTDGTIKNLYTRCFSNAHTTSSTITSRVNTAAGNMSVSIPSSTTGSFEDLTHADSVTSGSLVNYAMDGAAGTGTCAVVVTSCELLTTNSSTHQVTASSVGPTLSSASTNFFSIAGFIANGLEANTKAQAQLGAVFSNLGCRIITNTIATSSTLVFRKNTASGNQSVSIAGLGTGYFEDTTNTDLVFSTDEINYRFVVGTSVGNSLVLTVIESLVTDNNGVTAGAGAATFAAILPAASTSNGIGASLSRFSVKWKASVFR